MSYVEKNGQGGLWKAETSEGVKYYRGKVNISLDELEIPAGTDTVTLGVSVFVPDEKRSDKAPDLKIYIKRWEDRKGPGKSRFLNESPSWNPSVPPSSKSLEDEDIPF